MIPAIITRLQAIARDIVLIELQASDKQALPGAAVTFLASDEASYLTGVCLDVDGGRNI